jgi:hypothetical protein
VRAVAGIKFKYEIINYHISDELQINNIIETAIVEIDVESLLKVGEGNIVRKRVLNHGQLEKIILSELYLTRWVD